MHPPSRTGSPLSGSSSRWSRASATATSTEAKSTFAQRLTQPRWTPRTLVPDSLWLSRVQAELTEGERVSPVLTGMGLRLEAVGPVTLAWSRWARPPTGKTVSSGTRGMERQPHQPRTASNPGVRPMDTRLGHLSVDLDLEPDLGFRTTVSRCP